MKNMTNLVLRTVQESGREGELGMAKGTHRSRPTVWLYLLCQWIGAHEIDEHVAHLIAMKIRRTCTSSLRNFF